MLWSPRWGRDITHHDLGRLSRPAGLRPVVIDEMIDRTLAAVTEWPTLSVSNGVDREVAEQVASRLPALAE